MEKDYQDISKKDFKQHNKSAGYYHYPSPTYPKKLTEFDKLAYVASSVFNSNPKNSFKHDTDVSPFQPVVLGKK